MPSLKKLLIGQPLSNDRLHLEKIPKWKALAVLSSDALSSIAYATEEILIPLSAFAATGAAIAGSNTFVWLLPIGVCILFLLFILTLSYQQTISHYPHGGGAYTVAKENLGTTAGLIAGASLLIDYTLTVSVSVASGIENLISAFPSMAPSKILMDVVVIAVITLFNLRGVKESASVFALPVYFFIFSFIMMFGVAFFKAANGEIPTVPMPMSTGDFAAVPIMLLLRAFASGCAALTGIEAISNGIPLFENPPQTNAKKTMVMMSLLLGALFVGMTLFSQVFHLIPNPDETLVSQLAHKAFGTSSLYYYVQSATVLILLLAANTSYADYPRLASLIARDRFLPRQMMSLGDRLVFSNGILGLSLSAVLMIILFGGETHHLIPLYAVGVFLSFSLSQAGMVVRHWRMREPHWRKGLLINFSGCVTTTLVLLVVTYSKFANGAWIIVIAVPLFVFFFQAVRRHYDKAARMLNYASMRHVDLSHRREHLAIIPVSGVHAGVIKAIQYGLSIATEVKACTVDLDPVLTEKLRSAWADRVPNVPLIILDSPYRSVFRPLMTFIESEKEKATGKLVTVIVPEFITRRWYHQFLHNQTALFLYAQLRRKRGIVYTSIRYHLR